MKAIEVKDLSFSYGKHEVLEDINFSIEEGDFAAIIGANGSGKSTLMKLIIGEIKARTGSIEIFGKKVKKDMALPDLAYLGQEGLGDKSVFPASVYELVSTGIYRGLGKKLKGPDKARILGALERVGMKDLARKNIGKLSGGQRQRALLARALVSRPRILLLDEPSTGLDKEAFTRLYQTLKGLSDENNMTIITISHNLDRISPYLDRVFSLESSKLIELDKDSHSPCEGKEYENIRRLGSNV